MVSKASSFLEPGLRTTPGSLAIVSLARDDYEAITLEQSSGAVDGYAEGATLNTRFGSFPHSTLLNIPWGSQVRASAVDTGSRGRKRRLETADEDTPTASQEEGSNPESRTPARKAVTASSGFIYILRPSPELWTSSLPHRTQVVYTPDYSYILQRIRARPGTRLIEAGAGSGSFSHASARAVYNGYPLDDGDKKGKVFSFEFDETRYHKMHDEIEDHSLKDIVRVTHRDVYKDGFLVDGASPLATAIFLDLPAPWKALQHLSRRKPLDKGNETVDSEKDWLSPLDPKKSAYICTFSPCIEQVTRTVSELRTLGWTDIDMVEIAQKRINISRERVGVDLPSERGNAQTPANVSEAIAKLKRVNQRSQAFHQAQTKEQRDDAPAVEMDVDTSNTELGGAAKKSEHFKEVTEKPWLHGRLVHRSEGEIKTHTSYLVFAVLPREWSDEEEAAALAKWPCGQEKKTIGNLNKEARRQEKREQLESRKKRKTENDTQPEGNKEETKAKS